MTNEELAAYHAQTEKTRLKFREIEIYADEQVKRLYKLKVKRGRCLLRLTSPEGLDVVSKALNRSQCYSGPRVGSWHHMISTTLIWHNICHDYRNVSIFMEPIAEGNNIAWSAKFSPEVEAKTARH